jgi:hypothetical protein
LENPEDRLHGLRELYLIADAHFAPGSILAIDGGTAAA